MKKIRNSTCLHFPHIKEEEKKMRRRGQFSDKNQTETREGEREKQAKTLDKRFLFPKRNYHYRNSNHLVIYTHIRPFPRIQKT